MKPTHAFKALDKTTLHRTLLGAGWLNKDGSISISLNPCVVITPDPNIVLTLFPKYEENETTTTPALNPRQRPRT